ncbi:hypothetical protein Tco_1538524 [Tanacetum coccineum]
MFDQLENKEIVVVDKEDDNDDDIDDEEDEVIIQEDLHKILMTLRHDLPSSQVFKPFPVLYPSHLFTARGERIEASISRSVGNESIRVATLFHGKGKYWLILVGFSLSVGDFPKDPQGRYAFLLKKDHPFWGY